MTVVDSNEVGAGAGLPADSLDTERAERALRRYAQCVARRLGLGVEGVWCELADEAAAYLALDQRLASRPGQDVALVWDERRGWAVGVEMCPGDDPLMVAWYGPELLPSAEEVVRFARHVLAGRIEHPTPPSVPEHERRGLRARLASGSPAD